MCAIRSIPFSRKPTVAKKTKISAYMANPPVRDVGKPLVAPYAQNLDHIDKSLKKNSVLSPYSFAGQSEKISRASHRNISRSEADELLKKTYIAFAEQFEGQTAIPPSVVKKFFGSKEVQNLLPDFINHSIDHSPDSKEATVDWDNVAQLCADHLMENLAQYVRRDMVSQHSLYQGARGTSYIYGKIGDTVGGAFGGAGGAITGVVRGHTGQELKKDIQRGADVGGSLLRPVTKVVANVAPAIYHAYRYFGKKAATQQSAGIAEVMKRYRAQQTDV